MSDSKWKLIGALGVLAIIGGYVWFSSARREAPNHVSGTIYYTGPMRSKGDPNVWGVDGGQRVAAPTGINAPAPADNRPNSMKAGD